MVHAKGDGDIDEWKAAVGLTHPVKGLTSFDGQMSEDPDGKFVVENKGWNGETKDSQERTVTIQGQYESGQTAPKLQSLTLPSGKKIKCKKGGPAAEKEEDKMESDRPLPQYPEQEKDKEDKDKEMEKEKEKDMEKEEEKRPSYEPP